MRIEFINGTAGTKEDSALLDDVMRMDFEVFGESAWKRESFLEHAANSYDILGVAVKNGTDALIACGFFVLRILDDAEILKIAVAEGERRKGAGSYMVLNMVNEAGERGASRIFLEVRKGNEAALALYKKAGFKPVAVRKNYYRLPLEDAVVMELKL